jgi:hypothetical protein
MQRGHKVPSTEVSAAISKIGPLYKLRHAIAPA